jgi:hypothetical protein
MVKRGEYESRTYLGGRLRVARGRSPFLFGACVLFGLVGLYGALRPLFLLYASQSWTALPCTIVSSGFTSDTSQRYTEDVVYSYTVDGKPLQANRYEFAQVWYRDRTARAAKEAALTARYPPGSQTTCYVNPRDPAEAVLQRRVDTTFVVFLGGGSFLVTALGVWGLRGRQSTASEGLAPAG